jgi:hypothetical protein
MVLFYVIYVFNCCKHNDNIKYFFVNINFINKLNLLSIHVKYMSMFINLLKNYQIFFIFAFELNWFECY